MPLQSPRPNPTRRPFCPGCDRRLRQAILVDEQVGAVTAFFCEHCVVVAPPQMPARLAAVRRRPMPGAA